MKIWVVFGILLATGGVKAESSEGLLNRLLAPGPLFQGHHDLEGSDCLKCHDAGKGVPDGKCLDCHKEIQQEVSRRKGFHGLTRQTCIECHSDHKGRDFDAVDFDEKNFDHRSTGYLLEGKHANIKCVDCHKAKRIKKAARPEGIRFFGATSTCASCHSKEDIHKFTGDWAKKDCGSCHGLSSWKKEIRFNHEKDGRWALAGKHRELKCAECHMQDKKSKGPIYEWPRLKQSECLTCHKDQHKNNLSPKYRNGKCQECHEVSSWKISNFKHSITGFKLGGKHAEIKCQECHKQAPAVLPLGTKNWNWGSTRPECVSCHKDIHLFGKHQIPKFGDLNKCSGCHDDRSWETKRFNHNLHTRFDIDGKHIGVACDKCHVMNKGIGGSVRMQPSRQYKWKNPDDCAACHPNPHTKSFKPEFQNKKCTDCHVSEGWNVFQKKGLKFNHDKTRFALEGKHKDVKCAACHVVGKKEIFKFPSVDKKFCSDCHENVHMEQFSRDVNQWSCADCHNQKSFRDRLPFDHGRTHYPLKGKHGEVKCEECHKPTSQFFDTKPPRPMSKFLFPELAKRDCETCHEDFHKGQFLRNCSECHVEKAWKSLTFDHSKHSEYPLKGKHVDVKCADCHKPIAGETTRLKNQLRPLVRFKPLGSECGSCHKDPHKGTFGANCAECHLEKEWKQTKDFHKNFALSGVHYSLECFECHKNNRRLGGLGKQCIVCHKKDDIHLGSQPNCGDCHRQQFWEAAEFRHSMSLFPLRGSHRILECVDCHRNGVYKGTANRCLDCHEKDRLRVAGTHDLATRSECQSCHNQFTFQR